MSALENQPHLTCQELSKQCKDVDSSSSQLCNRWARRSLRKNAPSGSYQPSIYRKVSVGSVSQSSDPHPVGESSGTRYYHNRLEELSKELEMLDDQFVDEDDDDDDPEEDWGNCQRGETQNCAYRWLPNDGEFDDNIDEHQLDFLDEIGTSLHNQVDDEIEVFRSSLHSMISQQHHQCRQLWNQEQEESFSKMVPSHMVSDEQSSGQSPCQTVPHNPSSQDTWSSDIFHSSSDQPRIEAMSTSTSSILGDEGSMHFVPSLGSSSSNELSLEAEMNRLTVQLLTSALTISNALHRQEYAT
nr:uncharacterized protein LOC129258807 [Lytechinus pictus]